jgi:hypothetical protein
VLSVATAKRLLHGIKATVSRDFRFGSAADIGAGNDYVSSEPVCGRLSGARSAVVVETTVRQLGAIWCGRREEALTRENPNIYGLSSVLLHAMCSRGVQQVKGDATHIFVADFVRRREVEERRGTLPRPLGPSVAEHQRTQQTCQNTSSVGPEARSQRSSGTHSR